MLVRLHTADHIRLASPVQEEQGARPSCHRARIVRFTVGKKHAPVALVRAHRRQGGVSPLLLTCHAGMPSLGQGRQPHGSGPSQAFLTCSAARSAFFWTAASF